MKVLLTGLPRSGKTTLLQKLVEAVEPRTGFLTTEIRKDGERTGFEIITNGGRRAILASAQSKSPLRVSKYGVELEELERLLPELLNFSPIDLLYVDEIGRMELLSDKFKDFVVKYLDAENLFVGTISRIYSDDFVKEVKNRKDIEIVEVTPENRNELFDKLSKKLLSS